MIVPNRFSNLKFSLINITALVIDYLLQEKNASIDELLSHLKNFSKEFGRDDTIRAITLLYALGKIEYSEKKDRVFILDSSADKEAINA